MWGTSQGLVDLYYRSQRLTDAVYSYPPPGVFDDIKKISYHELYTRLLWSRGDFYLYIHIPFCYKICTFCNIHTHPYKSRESTEKYVDILCWEIADILSSLDQRNRLAWVYLGGGTPTVLSVTLISRIFETIDRYRSIKSVTSIEVDAHPATLTHDQVLYFQQIWVTQLTFGIQSLESKVLSKLNRHHQNIQTFEDLARKLQHFKWKIHFDMIVGLPHETLSWLRDSIDAVSQCIRIDSLSINVFDPTNEAKLSHTYSQLFASEAYTRRTHLFLEQLEARVQKTIGYERVLTPYFRDIREWRANLIWVWCGSYGYVRWVGYYRNPWYQTYLNRGDIPFLEDSMEEETRSMIAYHLSEDSDISSRYEHLLWRVFSEDFPDFWAHCIQGHLHPNDRILLYSSQLRRIYAK